MFSFPFYSFVRMTAGISLKAPKPQTALSRKTQNCLHCKLKQIFKIKSCTAFEPVAIDSEYLFDLLNFFYGHIQELRISSYIAITC